MTDELIDLEYAHMALDKQIKDGTQNFQDPEYEAYEKETDENDAILSYEYDVPGEPQASEDAKPTATEPDTYGEEEDWEDFET